MLPARGRPGEEVGMVRERVVADAGSALDGKSASREFDVFLVHNSQDKEQVRVLATELSRRGIKCWLDEEQIRPGEPFWDAIARAIPNVKCAVICIGPHGLGASESLEVTAFLGRYVESSFPVIPVMLPGVEILPEELVVLGQFNWVRFERTLHEEAALDQLEWGITGRRRRGRRRHLQPSR